MLRLMKDRSEIKVVDDQIGSPTYAADLAEAILQLVDSLQNGNEHFGTYHYSNTGNISWFQFATAIRDLAGLNCSVLPIPSTNYPTPAKRPFYSVMDTSKIVNDYSVQLKEWYPSLAICLKLLA